jgi:hypothetical protein
MSHLDAGGDDRGRPPMRYVTLAQARALECNGCGDCCDSRRTDGFWAWGALPEDRFASIAGEPLIIPIERVEDGGWRDRAWEPDDALPLRPTRFRCSAFVPHEDGTGGCGRHREPRPSLCGEFPVEGPEIEAGLAEAGEYELTSNSLPRCTWYRMTVVLEGDPRLG